jgi:hypothetical protein
MYIRIHFSGPGRARFQVTRLPAHRRPSSPTSLRLQSCGNNNLFGNDGKHPHSTGLVLPGQIRCEEVRETGKLLHIRARERDQGQECAVLTPRFSLPSKCATVERVTSPSRSLWISTTRATKFSINHYMSCRTVHLHRSLVFAAPSRHAPSNQCPLTLLLHTHAVAGKSRCHRCSLLRLLDVSSHQQNSHTLRLE